MKVLRQPLLRRRTELLAWAVTTSAGIIIIDADLRLLGRRTNRRRPEEARPRSRANQIRRDQPRAPRSRRRRTVPAGALWRAGHDDRSRLGLLERNTQTWPKPKRDIVVTDGQQLTLGDTTLTFIRTPGHTPGTMSTLVPVKDNGTPHVAALWGGTGFNFTITPERPAAYWFDAYISRHNVFAKPPPKQAQTCSSRTIRAGTDRRRRCPRWRSERSELRIRM